MTLTQLLNQNSFLLYSLLGLGGWLVVLIVRRASRRAWLLWLAAGGLAVGANLAARTAPPREFQSVAEVQQALAMGAPTLVEFYSNY
ncbi:MAG TPA: hypothetical protein VJG32_15075 [Anaerolineae bacterium]|nr:hypothetical protein [Anaerolineae bacterium]